MSADNKQTIIANSPESPSKMVMKTLQKPRKYSIDELLQIKFSPDSKKIIANIPKKIRNLDIMNGKVSE